jgi:hypothetical protein
MQNIPKTWKKSYEAKIIYYYFKKILLLRFENIKPISYLVSIISQIKISSKTTPK